MKKIFSFLFVVFSIYAFAQKKVIIPAYTAYAVPTEFVSDNDGENIISAKNGIQNWVDKNQQFVFYANIRNTGKLNIDVVLKNKTASSLLLITVTHAVSQIKAGATTQFTVAVPASPIFKRVNVGSVHIASTGLYTITIECKERTEKLIADIKELELSGVATKNIFFNTKQRRNAASVHLKYPIADTTKAIMFYNEVTVPAAMDPLYTYYMACGFSRGYFGMQVNSAGERRIIFSVWDAGNEAIDRNKVAQKNRVTIIAKGEDVVAESFGNEGTGGHSHWVYSWRTEQTYKFLVTAAIDSATQTTTYAGYFYVPEWQKWKLIACIKAPKDGKTINGLYSFNENFEGATGHLNRKAFFSNQWVRRQNGDWKELTESNFSYDATAKAGDRIDYSGGAVDTSFYLNNGGFVPTSNKFGEVFTRKATGNKPVIDFYRNADSAKQAVKDSVEIYNYTNIVKDSSWKKEHDVYFKILTQGAGNLVSVSDTVTVRYKGQLLNGFIFDETKDKPAVFPLKRLIKGWQLALPNCRVGGTIRIVLPSALAYTIRNLGDIPPNSVLVFDVAVESVK
jgi:hypothetical protein